MPSSRAKSSDRVPKIRWGWFKGELRAISVLNRSLARLDYYAKRFEATLGLFDWCQDQRGTIPPKERRGADAARFRRWQSIAGRDGAMTIFHFGKTMEGINAARRQLPEIFATIDRAQQKRAGRLFNQYFPQYIALRQAVAHAGELAVGIESYQANALPGQGWISDIFGEKQAFTMTFGGRLVSYELNSMTLENLNEVKREYYAAFSSAGHPPYLEE